MLSVSVAHWVGHILRLKQFKVVLIKARDFGSLQSPRLQFMLGKLKSPTIHLYLAWNKSTLHTSSLSFTLFSSSELGLRYIHPNNSFAPLDSFIVHHTDSLQSVSFNVLT